MVKICTSCRDEKPILGNFYPKRVRQDGVQTYTAQCISCQTIARNEYYLNNPEKKKATNRKSQLTKYGITPEDFDNLYNEQKGCCKGCGIHQSELAKRISVDHDHATNKVRGLLCQPCNTIIGLAKEDPNTLLELVNYINENNNLTNNIILMKAGS